MIAVKKIAAAVSDLLKAPLSELLQGSPVSQEKIRSGTGSLPWNDFVKWVQWMDQSPLGPIDWKQAGRLTVEAKHRPKSFQIARMAVSLKLSYWIAAIWLGPSLYGGIRCRFEDLGPFHVRETLTVHDGLDSCPQLWALFEGSLEWAPKAVFGLSRSFVQAEVSEREVIYDIQMPAYDTIWARMKSRILSVFQSQDLLRELASQQQKLQDQTAKIRSQTNEYQNLIETFPDGVLIHRLGTILYVNPRMASLLNLSSSAQIVGKNLLDLIDPSQHQDILDRTEHFSSQNNRFHQSFEISMIPVGSSEAIPFEYVCGPFSYEGQPAVAAVFRDLTDRKKLQSHLLLTDRMRSLGQLAAGVGHEINNPLFFVMMKADLLREHLRQKQDKEAYSSILEIEQGLQRISKIVKQLKDFTRGHGEEAAVLTDVAGTLRSSLGMAQNLIQHRAQLKLSIEELSPILGNEARLGQVFLNLLINAAQSIKSGQVEDNEIEVKAYEQDQQVVVEIRDTGTGISPEVQKTLFTPFHTTKLFGEGTGLGLSICQSIVQLYNGKLDYETQVGWGTVFRVRFPTAKGEIVSSARKDPQPSVQTAGKVLLIDDDEELLNVLETIVSDSYEVDAFLKAEKALAKIESGATYDCIICDLMMPSMDGASFYQKMTTVAPEMKDRIVFMTGGSLTKQHDNFLATPGVQFREKPLNSTELMGLIQYTILSGKKKSSNGVSKSITQA